VAASAVGIADDAAVEPAIKAVAPAPAAVTGAVTDGAAFDATPAAADGVAGGWDEPGMV
jgi:hypothetical protein